jgi:hypothetical protein
VHTLERRGGLFSRHRYECGSCGGATVPCRDSSCGNLAVEGAYWSDEYCFRHGLRSQFTEDGEIECVTDWADLISQGRTGFRGLRSLLSLGGDNVESFNITQVSPGGGGSERTPDVIFVNGFLNQSQRNADDWDALRTRRFPESRSFYVRWESIREFEMTGAVATSVGSVVAGSVVLGPVLSAAGPWIKACGRRRRPVSCSPR